MRLDDFFQLNIMDQVRVMNQLHPLDQARVHGEAARRVVDYHRRTVAEMQARARAHGHDLTPQSPQSREQSDASD